MTYIYALCDPETHEIRYVGKANNIDDRLKNHRNDKHETRKVRWLRSLQKRGLQPEVIILAEVEESNWQESEQYWIAHFRGLGLDLTNHTEGGEGLHNPTADTRAKISSIRKAAFQNPEYRSWYDQWVRSPARREKISRALRGRKKSAEHVAKLPQNQPGGNQHARGLRHTEATRATISAKLKGNSHTLGRQMPEDEKRKRSESLQGRPKTEEHREKIRQAALRRWARERSQRQGRSDNEELPGSVQQEADPSERADSRLESDS